MESADSYVKNTFFPTPLAEVPGEYTEDNYLTGARRRLFAPGPLAKNPWQLAAMRKIGQVGFWARQDALRDFNAQKAINWRRIEVETGYDRMKILSVFDALLWLQSISETQWIALANIVKFVAGPPELMAALNCLFFGLRIRADYVIVRHFPDQRTRLRPWKPFCDCCGDSVVPDILAAYEPQDGSPLHWPEDPEVGDQPFKGFFDPTDPVPHELP